MNRPILFSIFISVASIMGTAETSQALCFNGNNVSLNRRSIYEDNAFVSSSPANADSNFKIELDLNNGLDIFSTDTEEEASVGSTEAVEILDSDDEAAVTIEQPTVTDLEADSSSAADLDTADLEAQTQISRADYLNSRANEINDCF